VFAICVAALLFTSADVLQRQGSPTCGWNITPAFADKDHLFGSIAAICFSCTGRTLPFVASKLGSKKVSVLAYGVSEESKQGAEGTRASFQQFPPAAVGYLDD